MVVAMLRTGLVFYDRYSTVRMWYITRCGSVVIARFLVWLAGWLAPTARGLNEISSMKKRLGKLERKPCGKLRPSTHSDTHPLLVACDGVMREVVGDSLYESFTRCALDVASRDECTAFPLSCLLG